MNATDTTSPAPTKTRPGTGLIKAGIIIAAIGLLLTAFFAAAAHIASPLAIVILVAGLILAGAGFGRRVLAALENK